MKEEYPAIYQYLENHESELKDRAQVKKSRNNENNKSNDYPGQHHWLELDNNPKPDYINKFESKKVAWPDIASKPRFSILPKGVYLKNTAYMISGGDPYYLAGLLNSEVTKFVFEKIGTDLGKKGNRFFKQFVKQLPIPKKTVDQKLSEDISNLSKEITEKRKRGEGVSNLKKKIDELVMDLYKLTEEEKEIIRNS